MMYVARILYLYDEYGVLKGDSICHL